MIVHNRPTLGEAETIAAQKVIDSGWIAQGPEVAALEQDVCALMGLPDGHAVALSSGTAALFMALRVLGTQGLRVAIPVYSCAALRNAVVMAGGTPVPVDVTPGSPNIDLAAAIDSQVDLVIAAHMFGIPLHWNPDTTPVPVIEDCAQALGARVNGRHVGLEGRAGIFSFYATKMITSGGQGGMLVSQDRSLVDLVRDYREFDGRNDRKPRFNFQMTDLQAAVGRAQLRQLPDFIGKRQEIFDEYMESGMALMSGEDAYCQPVRYRAVVRSETPRQLIRTLLDAGVKAIVPVEEGELLDGPVRYPEAARLTATTVSLPIYPSLSVKNVRHIAAVAGSTG